MSGFLSHKAEDGGSLRVCWPSNHRVDKKVPCYEGFLLLFICVKEWLWKQKLLSDRQTTLYFLPLKIPQRENRINFNHTYNHKDWSDFRFTSDWSPMCSLLTHNLSKTHGLREERSEVAQSCLTLCNPMDYSLPGSLVCGIFQARVLKWVAIFFSRGFSWPRDQTWVSCIVGRHFYSLSHLYRYILVVKDILM